MTEGPMRTKNCDGKWTPPPEIPGSIRHLKRELEDRNKRLVAAYDVIAMARQYMWLSEDDMRHSPAHSRLEDALEAYDKAMERE